jgi:hypothetical protein
VPVHPSHPDPEELTAWQAGDLSGPGGAHVEVHVAGCADCAGRVAAVERGRAALAGLAEVEPPAGLHGRLAAAIEHEAAAPTLAGAGDGPRERRITDEPGGAEERRVAAAGLGTDGRKGRRQAAATDGDGLGESGPVAEPIPLDGRRRGRRSPSGRRRIAALSTAAALILLVVGLVPLLRHGGGQTVATPGAGRGAGATSRALGGSAQGSLPVFPAPAGYSGTALQSALTTNPAVRSAYRRAAEGAAGAARLTPPEQPGSGGSVQSGGPPQLDSKRGSGGSVNGGSGGSGSTAKSPGGDGGTAAGAPAAGEFQQATCVASARDQAGDQGLQPAFFVDTQYRGRPATVLVTVKPGAPDQADLWAFSRGDCSAPPFAHEPVAVTPP